MYRTIFSFVLCSCLSFQSMILSAALQKKDLPNQSNKALPKDEIAVFTPPAGWQKADPNAIKLPPKVRAMFVGKGPSVFPPSINLSSEAYQGTLKQYMKIIKDRNEEKGYEWKDLGLIPTHSGQASLSQVDNKSQWGDVRLMHVILLKNGTIYIMTASALKSEFSLYYQDFFKSMRSLRIVTDMIDIISNKEQKAELKNEIQKICDHWKLLLAEKQKIDPQANLEELQKEVFNSESFQSTTWGPFKEMLNKKFTDLGSDWQSTIEKQVQEELFALPDRTKQNLSNNPKDESKESLYV